MVTAELAIGLLIVVGLALTCLWAVGLGAQQLAVGDVAVQVARYEARGDHKAARQVMQRATGVTVTVRRVDRRVEVTASALSRRLGMLPSVTLTGQASAALEPGER